MRISATTLLSFLLAVGLIVFAGRMTGQNKPTTDTKTPTATKAESEDEDDESTDEEGTVEDVPLEKKLEAFTEKSFISKHVATTQAEAYKITKARKWPRGATVTYNTVIRLDTNSVEVLTKAHSHETKYVCAVDLPAWECPKTGTSAASCKLDDHTLIGIQYHTVKSAAATKGGANPDFMYHIRKPSGAKLCALN